MIRLLAALLLAPLAALAATKPSLPRDGSGLSEPEKATLRVAIGLPIGTSGPAVPLLNGANTWSGTNTFTNAVAGSGGTIEATAVKSGSSLAASLAAKATAAAIEDVVADFAESPTDNGQFEPAAWRAALQGGLGIVNKAISFDGTARATFSAGLPLLSGPRGIGGWFQSTGVDAVLFGSGAGGLVAYFSSSTNSLSLNHQGVTNGGTWALRYPAKLSPVFIYLDFDGSGWRCFANGVECVLTAANGHESTGNRLNYTADQTTSVDWLGGDSGVSFANGLLARWQARNRSLDSAAQRGLFNRGGVGWPEETGAGMTALNAAEFYNSLGGVPYSTFSGASATGFTAVMATATQGRAVSGSPFQARKGQKYRLTYTLVINSGAAPEVYFNNENISGDSAAVALTAGTHTIEITAITNNMTRLAFGTQAATNYVLSGVSLIPLGALYAMDDGDRSSSSVVADLSGNGHDLLLPAGGVYRVRPRPAEQYIVATNGGGGSTISLATATVASVISLTIPTDGDWLVGGLATCSFATATATALQVGISVSPTIIPSASFQDTAINPALTSASAFVRLGPPATLKQAHAGDVIYLVIKATFSAGSADAYGRIWARRLP